MGVTYRTKTIPEACLPPKDMKMRETQINGFFFLQRPFFNRAVSWILWPYWCLTPSSIHPGVTEATVSREICYWNGILDQHLSNHYRFFFSQIVKRPVPLQAAQRKKRRKALNFLATEFLLKHGLNYSWTNCLCCTLGAGQWNSTTVTSLSQQPRDTSCLKKKKTAGQNWGVLWSDVLLPRCQQLRGRTKVRTKIVTRCNRMIL